VNIEVAGVALNDWEAHWKRSASAKPEAIVKAGANGRLPEVIEIRTAKVREGHKHIGGDPMAWSRDEPGVREIVDDLEAHNAFMRAYGVQGIDFLALRRVFNDGDQPAQRWKAGGRFYSLVINGIGTAYENMRAQERLKVIRLGGNPVGEIDMSASQLRLLYAVQDVPMAEALASDPYVIAGFERDPIKWVVAQALGKNAARSERWGAQAVTEYKRETGGRSLGADFNFRAHQEATLAAHPILESLGQPGAPGALRLQWIESEIIRRAMAALRTQGIGCLPVHDSLLAPIGSLDTARRALEDAFKAQVQHIIGCSTNHFAMVKQKA